LRGRELARAYAAVDIFVFPAANETFGNVILEAIASRLPVVAAAAGGPLDFVVDRENGLLFASDDRSDMVRVVGQLIEDPFYARRRGKEGRARAEVRSWPVVLDGLLEDYATLMATLSLTPCEQVPGRLVS
jgi:phosphatidylinositol alpha 1,6-mannosyltransferase